MEDSRKTHTRWARQDGPSEGAQKGDPIPSELRSLSLRPLQGSLKSKVTARSTALGIQYGLSEAQGKRHHVCRPRGWVDGLSRGVSRVASPGRQVKPQDKDRGAVVPRRGPRGRRGEGTPAGMLAFKPALTGHPRH